MTVFRRRELTVAGCLAAFCAVSARALAASGAPAQRRSSRRFVYDAALDPSGITAQAMASAGWSIDRVDGGIDAVFSCLAVTETPFAVAGLTCPAARFVAEQIARRRGMRPIGCVAPIWAFGFDGSAGAIA